MQFSTLKRFPNWGKRSPRDNPTSSVPKWRVQLGFLSSSTQIPSIPDVVIKVIKDVIKLIVIFSFLQIFLNRFDISDLKKRQANMSSGAQGGSEP